MTFRVVRTNQYNQDLGLIHSTNGNHLESSNEGSSIDHQVTIYLHAQNITMFPTNETWLNSNAYISSGSSINLRAIVGSYSIEKTVLLTSASSHMFRGNSDACVSATVESITVKKTVLLTHSLHSTMESAFITYSYQINFESVLMMHDHDGLLNMFKALETSGLRGILGCESVLYEKELEQFFETALVQGEDITGAVSRKFFSISQAQFAHVFALPTEGIVNFSDVPKDKVYDARSFFSKKGEQVEIHGKKKPMKYEFRLLNDILAKAITVKAGSFDAVTVERFQIMTAIHYGLKVNWGKVLFNVLKDMVDRSQRKAKGFAAQIGVLLKGMPTITMGDGVSFPSAKILSMKTVNTYIATNTTIDAHEEQGMVGEATVKRKSKSIKQSSSTGTTPVKVISDIAELKKRVATEDNAPAIPKKRHTVKTKPSFSQASLDIVNVAQDVVPIQVIDPTPAVATITSPVPKRKSRKRRLVLSTGSDDEIVGAQEIVKDGDAVAITSTDEADIIIAKVLEETLELGVSEIERGGQGVDEALFEEDFARWLDDFVARNSEPEFVDTRIDTRAEGNISSVVDKEMKKSVDREQVTEETMSIDDLLLQISDDLMLPSITAVELTRIWLGESLNFGDVQERDLYSASLPWISSHDTFVSYFSGSSIQTNSEIDLSSSDGSTVYRSPSPVSPEVDSFEHDLRFALGPAIFSSVEQEERLYFVQSPESCAASSPHQESSPSSTDVSVHFDSTDVPLNAQEDTHASATVDFTMFTDTLEDLRSYIFQRINDSNCEILSKVNAVELGVRVDLLKLQINDLKKGLMAPVGTIFGDLIDIKKKQREQDAKIIALDGQIAAIRSEQLDFQTKIAADILSLSTQVGDIADYIRGGDAKKGEIGSSSRPSTVRTQTQTFLPMTGTFAERAEQARRHIIESGTSYHYRRGRGKSY
ncbi:heat shock factor-binding protein 1 [Dorcoceras hygrometricum]|uniref:Heat shock factor-binding protein 1 n=1 Tax=Dorcoceras hygrometricum TaxID=472368 RepID=A0A2Z7BWR4_9LAMI|nr:heat shock factor-binding protein 1 [Dorcoceras hygrometricum]